MLTQSFLKEYLYYNEVTGILTWKKRLPRANKTKVGEEAGSLGKNGYRSVYIFGKNYYSHRIIWLYVYGEIPLLTIDHINGNKTDNRIENLRQATNSQNQMNRKTQINNTSGHKGIRFNSSMNKWTAECFGNNKRFYLGSFEKKDDAINAYKNKIISMHGEFVNLN